MMKRRILVLLTLALLLIAAVGAAAVAAPNTGPTDPGSTANTSSDHIRVALKPVGGSHVHGVVDLTQLSGSGTHIMLKAKGLTPRHKYVSLYYDNHKCHLEPYSKDDIIGHYSANKKGVGHTSSNVTDDLDEINSVSVRTANFQLKACADVHP